jgi:hypothetical protein
VTSHKHIITQKVFQRSELAKRLSAQSHSHKFVPIRKRTVTSDTLVPSMHKLCCMS